MPDSSSVPTPAAAAATPVGAAVEPVDLLCIGPHPDDVELTSAGLLLKAKQMGYRTAAIDLTQGEMGTRGTPEIRAREIDAATELLRLDYRSNTNIPDGGVRVEPEYIERLVRELRKLQPRVVVIPPREDDHPDHFHASRLCLEAVHFANKRKFLPEVPITQRIQQVLFAMYRQVTRPDFIVDISDVMERAQQVVNVFGSQLGTTVYAGDENAPPTVISNPAFMHWWLARRAAFGMEIGATYGEPYMVRQPLRINDPIAVLTDPLDG